MNVKLTDSDFRRLSEYIESQLGIKMPRTKKQLLESRLLKRLRALGMGSYVEYCEYLFSPEGHEHEIVTMIDLVTTNKTDFFREPDHFDYLFNTALPELVKSYGAGVRKTLMVWSAGCSTGEEPYTLAMIMSEFAERYPGLGFDYTILATDISTRVVDAAAKGIYSAERVAPVPEPMRKKYLLRSKNREQALVRVVTELRERVRVRRLNFMDDEFGFREPLDIIFCRNVIIYFDKETQERLLQKFCDNLKPGCYIFLGHSETLSGFDVPLERVAPSVYRKLA